MSAKHYLFRGYDNETMRASGVWIVRTREEWDAVLPCLWPDHTLSQVEPDFSNGAVIIVISVEGGGGLPDLEVGAHRVDSQDQVTVPVNLLFPDPMPRGMAAFHLRRVVAAYVPNVPRILVERQTVRYPLRPVEEQTDRV